jgi:predicted transporter
MEVISFFSPSIILLTLIFAVVMGLGLKSLKVSKKFSIISTFACSLAIVLLIILLELNVSLVNSINSYNLLILMIIGFITVVLGIVMVKESKKTKLNINKLNILSFTFIPLFIISIIVVISFFSTQDDFNMFLSSLAIATGFVIFTVISYFLSKYIKSFKKPFGFFSNLNIFLGVIGISLSLILPNVVVSINNQMGGIEVDSPMLLGICLAVFILLIVVGLFLTRRNNILIKKGN